MTPAAAIIAAIEAHERTLAALRQALADIEPNVAEQWLSPKQAAFLVGASERTMYRRAHRIGVRIGREWRIDPKMLAAEVANDGEGRHTETDANQIQSKDDADG